MPDKNKNERASSVHGEFEADDPTPIEMPPLLRAARASDKAKEASASAATAAAATQQSVEELRTELVVSDEKHDKRSTAIETSMKDLGEKVTDLGLDVAYVKGKVEGLDGVVAAAAAAAERAANAVDRHEASQLAIRTTHEVTQMQLTTTRDSQAMVEEGGKKEQKRTIAQGAVKVVVAILIALAGFLGGHSL